MASGTPPMKWYPWLRTSYQQIIASHQAGRGHHALLIHSLPGMGEQSLAYAISRWILCQQPDGEKSCGHCRACQLMQAGTHPDYYPLQAETGKTVLGIDAIRQLCEAVYKYARMGGGKVVCVTQAEQLNEAAANALLKTLEEPPHNTWFILNCHQPQRLPATLRSRCAQLHLPVPEAHYVQNWLAQETGTVTDSGVSASVQAALQLSGGAPLAALQLLQPDYAVPRQQLCEAIGQALTSADWYALLPRLQDDQFPYLLHWFATLLLDALKYQQGAQHWLTNPDQQIVVQHLASLPVELLHWLIRALFRCREQCCNIAGLNRELMLADLLLQIEHYQQPGVTVPW